MNKQDRLISADKLLEWLDVEIDMSDGNDPVLKADRWAFGQVKKAVESGRFNPDPIPLPTIKYMGKNSSAAFKCPCCNESSSEYEWNLATLNDYCGEIILINDPRSKDSVFICPKCEKLIDYMDLELIKGAKEDE